MATLIATPQEITDAFDFHSGEDFKAYDQRSNAAFAKLEEASSALPDGEVVGALIQFPHADGYAIYRVASAKPLKLQHIPYGDAWHADASTIRGLRLADVQSMVGRSRMLRSMFAKK